MRLSIYHCWKTFGRYLFGGAYLIWYSKRLGINPYVDFYIYSCLFSMMHAWTPFKERIPEGIVYRANVRLVTIISLVLALVSYYFYKEIGVEIMGIMMLTQILRASIEEFPGKMKILERIVIDFFILLTGLVFNQIVVSTWIYVVTTAIVSGLNVVRYIKCIVDINNPLKIVVVEE